MTSRTSLNPLRLELTRSRYLLTYLCLSHGAVLTVLLVTLWSTLWLLLVVPAVIGSAVYHGWCWQRRCRAYAPIALRFADGRWYLTLAGRRNQGAVEQVADLLDASVWRSWLILRLRAERTHTVLVFPDSADTDVIRRLRVLLRFGAVGPRIRDSSG